MRNLTKVIGVNLAVVGACYFAIDNILSMNKKGSVQETYTFEMRHSANINISERPPKFYQDISNDNLFTQEVVFRTSDIGDILPRGGKGSCKVFFFGGSTTENHWTPESSRWVHLIGQRLESTIRTYNFGVGGYNGYQNFLKMHSYALKEKPDMVVSMNQINDISKFIGSKFSSIYYYTEPGTLHGTYSLIPDKLDLPARLRDTVENLLPSTTIAWRRYRNRSIGIPKTRIEAKSRDNSLEFRDKFSRIFIPRYISVLKANAELLISRETKFAIILQPNRLKYILKNDENTVDVKHLSAQLQKAGAWGRKPWNIESVE